MAEITLFEQAKDIIGLIQKNNKEGLFIGEFESDEDKKKKYDDFHHLLHKGKAKDLFRYLDSKPNLLVEDNSAETNEIYKKIVHILAIRNDLEKAGLNDSISKFEDKVYDGVSNVAKLDGTIVEGTRYVSNLLGFFGKISNRLLNHLGEYRNHINILNELGYNKEAEVQDKNFKVLESDLIDVKENIEIYSFNKKNVFEKKELPENSLSMKLINVFNVTHSNYAINYPSIPNEKFGEWDRNLEMAFKYAKQGKTNNGYEKFINGVSDVVNDVYNYLGKGNGKEFAKVYKMAKEKKSAEQISNKLTKLEVIFGADNKKHNVPFTSLYGFQDVVLSYAITQNVISENGFSFAKMHDVCLCYDLPKMNKKERYNIGKDALRTAMYSGLMEANEITENISAINLKRFKNKVDFSLIGKGTKIPYSDNDVLKLPTKIDFSDSVGNVIECIDLCKDGLGATGVLGVIGAGAHKIFNMATKKARISQIEGFNVDDEQTMFHKFTHFAFRNILKASELKQNLGELIDKAFGKHYEYYDVKSYGKRKDGINYIVTKNKLTGSELIYYPDVKFKEQKAMQEYVRIKDDYELKNKEQINVTDAEIEEPRYKSMIGTNTDRKLQCLKDKIKVIEIKRASDVLE